MAQVSKFLRKGAGDRYIFYCPACDEPHVYRCHADATDRPRWEFNGNVDRPTFTPSLLLFDIPAPGQRTTICHLFVKEGMIEYCGDCPHEYAGKTIPLPELPENMQSDRFGDGNP